MTDVVRRKKVDYFIYYVIFIATFVVVYDNKYGIIYGGTLALCDI